MGINFIKALKSSAGETKENIKSKFRKAPVLPSYPEPLGFRIGAAITLDSLEFRVLADKLTMKFPGETQIINAYGQIDMGGGTMVHRFYTTDDCMFQITTENGDDNIKEVKLFVPHDEVFPATEEEWDFWIGQDGLLGDTEFELQDETNFFRAWFEDSDFNVDPVEFDETVVTDKETGESFLIEHKAMLYARWIDDAEETAEWLLISAEDTGDGASVELMLGVDITENGFSVA